MGQFLGLARYPYMVRCSLGSTLLGHDQLVYSGSMQTQWVAERNRASRCYCPPAWHLFPRPKFALWSYAPEHTEGGPLAATKEIAYCALWRRTAWKWGKSKKSRRPSMSSEERNSWGRADSCTAVATQNPKLQRPLKSGKTKRMHSLYNRLMYRTFLYSE